MDSQRYTRAAGREKTPFDFSVHGSFRFSLLGRLKLTILKEREGEDGSFHKKLIAWRYISGIDCVKFAKRTPNKKLNLNFERGWPGGPGRVYVYSGKLSYTYKCKFVHTAKLDNKAKGKSIFSV